MTSPARIASVPNQPKTPVKCFRVPEDEWEATMVQAKRNGETLTTVLRRAMAEYRAAGDKPKERS